MQWRNEHDDEGGYWRSENNYSWRQAPMCVKLWNEIDSYTHQRNVWTMQLSRFENKFDVDYSACIFGEPILLLTGGENYTVINKESETGEILPLSLTYL